MRTKERKLAAIMFTDIVGYSAMMQKSEETANRLRVRHREVFNRLTTQYGGEILQYFGDGTLSIFSSATAAAECAVALQQALKKDPQVPLRIGIHTGEITFSDEEAYGDGVNIAARLESICVPGGVFISGKVYDEIKNHSRLKAKPIGRQQMKNIQQELDVYAISNAGITTPDFELPPVVEAGVPAAAAPLAGKKNKWVTFLLAFFFGIFGIHRFYLQQRLRGMLHLVVFLLAAIVNLIPDEAVGVLAIIGFIDSMIFLTMPKADFDARYNAALVQREQAKAKARQEEALDTRRILRERFNSHVSKASSLHRNYDYEGSIQCLEQALEIQYDEPEAHFLLACCYSVNENTEKALYHLDLASAFGLENLEERIRSDDDLSYLRIQPKFEVFARNGYRLPKELPPPRPDLLEQEPGLKLKEQREAAIEDLDAPKHPANKSRKSG